MNIGDKRAQICAMGFIPVAASVVKNMPGVETIQVSGEWTPIPVSSGEFKEKNDQFPVVVTLQESGSPAAFTLSFKRSSPEPAKILKSF